MGPPASLNVYAMAASPEVTWHASLVGVTVTAHQLKKESKSGGHLLHSSKLGHVKPQSSQVR